MKKQRVSKAAFDRWFTDTHGKPATEAQIVMLHKKMENTGAALALARMRAQEALESAMLYDKCYAAWLAAREAHNE